MGTSSPSGPAVFRYGNSPVVVVMPMFVQWGDEPAEEKQPEAAVESTPVEEGLTEPEDGFQEPPEVEESGGGPGEEEEVGEEPTEAPVEVGSEQE